MVNGFMVKELVYFCTRLIMSFRDKWVNKVSATIGA